MGQNERSAIVMSPEEIARFIERSRTATLATIGADGLPHLVAMWYGWLGGVMYFETKSRSQKAVNLRRDRRAVVSLEAGTSYGELRGVSIEGEVTLIEDATVEEYWTAAQSVYERYVGVYTEDARPSLELMMHKRIIVRLDPARVRSWDHTKLDPPAMPIGGTTAAFDGRPSTDRSAAPPA